MMKLYYPYRLEYISLADPTLDQFISALEGLGNNNQSEVTLYLNSDIVKISVDDTGLRYLVRYIHSAFETYCVVDVTLTDYDPNDENSVSFTAPNGEGYHAGFHETLPRELAINAGKDIYINKGKTSTLTWKNYIY